MILAVDTSGALSSVALVEGGEVLDERRHLDARRHAEVLSPMLADLLRNTARGSVDAVACGVGPGPYTGLRVGIATAIAVGRAWDVPVHGICSLDAVAMAVLARPDASAVGVALDARRREVYWACYSSDGERVEGPRVSLPAEMEPGVLAGPWVGSGALLHPEAFAEVVDAGDLEAVHPHASWVGRRVEALLVRGVARGTPPPNLDEHGADSGATAASLAGAALLAPRPLYLRRPDAVPAAGWAGLGTST